jgi:arginase
MPLAVIAGLAGPQWRGAAELVVPIPTDRILVAGAREFDAQEEQLIKSTSLRLVRADELSTTNRYQEQLDRLVQTCEAIYLHVDLDVLDPSLVPSSSTPSEHGLSIAELVELMSAALATGKVAVLAISSLNPGAGARGERSIKSTLAVIEDAIRAWQAAPCLRAEQTAP